MLLGLISDTHGLLRPEVFDAFQGVDRILHAGDVGDQDILIELESIAEVTAVWGNTDDFSLRHRLPERAEIELDGRRILVVHGHQYGRPTAAALAGASPGFDLVLFGHSHTPEIGRIGGVLAVNPGSAGPARFTLPISVALAEIGEESVSARIVELVRR